MQRSPLAVISSNRRRNTELKSHERALLVGTVYGGKMPAEIERDEGIPESTTRTTIKRHFERHNGVSKPRQGRPPKLTDRTRRHIIRLARADPKLKYEELLKLSGSTCHRNTVYKVLKDYGLTNWLAKKRPLLTPEVASLRLQWCLARRDWTYDQWKDYIWSDECSVERGTGKE